MLKQLTKGADIRNELLHRPIEREIEIQEAEQYVLDVETAIYHLLHLLYPQDQFIHYLFSGYAKWYWDKRGELE